MQDGVQAKGVILRKLHVNKMCIKYRKKIINVETKKHIKKTGIRRNGFYTRSTSPVYTDRSIKPVPMLNKGGKGIFT